MESINEIKRTIAIWCKKGFVYELRVPKTKRRGTISGYFDNPMDLYVEADTLSDDIDVPAVYMTLNPVQSKIIARSYNQITDRSDSTTKDSEILVRHRLLIDLDPMRPSGISSSNDEHEQSIELAYKIFEFLASEGFSRPIIADSGNGAHLVYGIDLPNNDSSSALVKGFLSFLALKFDSEAVGVDRSVWNASRINKLYGTMTRKGSNCPERPWRRSRILDAPEELLTIPEDLIQTLVGGKEISVSMFIPTNESPKVKQAKAGKYTPEKVEQLLIAKGIAFKPAVPYENGLKWTLDACPWGDEHTTGVDGAAVFLRDGVVGFDCKHAHCQDRDVKDLFGTINKVKDPKNFDKIALEFIKDCVSKGQNPLNTGGRNYFYVGTHYIECHELEMKIRNFFRENNLHQTNSVIGNVIPIVESYSWKDFSKVGEMPFWDGENKPFKSEKNVIAFSNGLLDLENPVDLIPHSPKWISSMCLPYSYDSQSDCPLWIKFLDEVFENDQEKLDLVQEFFGYCLTSDTSLQKALILVGKPRSGKGTIQRILGALVGAENSTGFSLERLATEFGCSGLVGKNVALVGELELSANPNRSKIVEVLKSIIGEDQMSINTKYQARLPSLRLPSRFVIATNTVPRLLDSSGALAHRFLFLPFYYSFIGKEDYNLEEKLLKELSGIALWSMKGLERLRSNGGKFTLGTSHELLATQYSTETSPILAWIKSEVLVHKSLNSGDLPEECLTSERNSLPKVDAFDNYLEWCSLYDIEPSKQSWFGRDLRTVLPKLTEERVANVHGARISCYRGICLRGAQTIVI